MIVWALSCSWLPLVASLSILGLLLRPQISTELFPVQLNGWFQLQDDGVLELNGHRDHYLRSALQLSPLFVVIFTDRQRLTIWRDSCDDRDYRRLLYLLRLLDKRRLEP